MSETNNPLSLPASYEKQHILTYHETFRLRGIGVRLLTGYEVTSGILGIDAAQESAPTIFMKLPPATRGNDTDRLDTSRATNGEQ